MTVALSEIDASRKLATIERVSVRRTAIMAGRSISVSGSATFRIIPTARTAYPSGTERSVENRESCMNAGERDHRSSGAAATTQATML